MNYYSRPRDELTDTLMELVRQALIRAFQIGLDLGISQREYEVKRLNQRIKKLVNQ